MSVLVFVDNQAGKASKASLEAISYAKSVADQAGDSVTAVTYGRVDGDAGVGAYGASKLLVAASITAKDSKQLTAAMAKAAEQEGSSVIVLSHDHTGKHIGPRLSVRLQAGMVPGAISLPETTGEGMVVKKNVFSGKAIAKVAIKTEKKILAVLPNGFGLHPSEVSCSVESLDGDFGGSSVTVKSTSGASNDGEIPLPEAELVVSAGRGLKGPENWGMVEELAGLMGAATACSRPVSDIGWRPHHEHVGQTGIAIRPNLYIAIGISGAIQHLAGVNGSKVIVVINKDPEAPFFKAADYGIVGDAFEVVPKLIDAVKAYKNN